MAERKQRRPGRTARPIVSRTVAARPAPPPPEPARLPQALSRAQAAAVAVVAVTGFAGLAGYVDAFSRYDDHPAVPLAITLAGAVALFALERDAVIAMGTNALRFGIVGGAGPLFYWLVGAGCPGPICALQGMTAWRLGRGSVFPPTVAGTISTGIVYGPGAGLLVFAAFALSGVGGLLISRV